MTLLATAGIREWPGRAKAAGRTRPYVATNARSQYHGFGVTRTGGRRVNIVEINTSAVAIVKTLGRFSRSPCKRLYRPGTVGIAATIPTIRSTLGLVKKVMMD
jgi:hypothetical protein